MTAMRARSFTLLLSLGAADMLACTGQQQPPVVQEAFLPDSAEQMAFGVSFNLTDQGVMRAAVKADTLLQYRQGTWTELRQVTTTFFTETGEKDAVLTAREGTHQVRIGTMEARGNVVVVSTDGRRLETEQLKYDPSRNEITSDSAFTLTEGNEVTKGVGFISDPEMTRIQVLAGLKTSGRQVTIPKK
jgi:LPS export ABC transporter protein LptC